METPIIPQAAAICGLIVVPLVTSLLKREDWPTELKQVVAVVVAAGCAVVDFAAQQGWTEITFASVLGNFAAIYAIAQTAYLGFWERAGAAVDTALESVPLLPARGS